MARQAGRVVQLVESNNNPIGVRIVNPRLVNKTSDPSDLVEIAKQIQTADDFVRANACNKLSIILEQMKYLQQQAKKVLMDAKNDAELHHAACNLVKKPGTIYHLYRRQSGQTYFSILSPEEWGSSCPHEYIASYKLEHDMSWTPQEKIEERGKELAMLDKLIHSQVAIEDSSRILQGRSQTVTVEEVDHHEPSASDKTTTADKMDT